MTLDDASSLIDAPSPAVLTKDRKDGSAFTTPVSFRFYDGAFERIRGLEPDIAVAAALTTEKGFEPALAVLRMANRPTAIIVAKDGEAM